MRRPPMPPLFEDRAPISFSGVRGRARGWDAASHGTCVGRDTWRRQLAGSGHANCFVAPCEWEALESDLRHVWHRQLSGFHGLVPCKCCKTGFSTISAHIVEVLNGEQAQGCLGEFQTATHVFHRSGFVGRSGVARIAGGSTSSTTTTRPNLESGRMAGNISRFFLFPNTVFRETVVVAQSCAVDQAHLRSHS